MSIRPTSWLALLALTCVPAGASGQPRPVEDVSIRAELSVEETSRQIQRDGWTIRHNGPWLHANDEWTNEVGVSFFPANTEYFIAVVIESCSTCTFQVRFFDEEAGGYFPLDSVLRVESDGGMTTATGRFGVERDTRGSLYLQMIDDSTLYPTYMVLAQIR